MTRKEAEERIIKGLEEIREAYLAYNPDGDWLSVSISRNFLNAYNDFSYGGKDYEHPISVSGGKVKGEAE